MLIFGSAAILIFLTVGVVLAYKFGLFAPSNFSKKNRNDEKVHELHVVKKLSDVRIGNYNMMFFATGMVISLFFTYKLINFTDVITYLNEMEDELILLAEEELVTITDQTPPPPPPPKPEVVIPEIIESPEPIIEDTIVLTTQDEDPLPTDDPFDFSDLGDDEPVVDNSLYDLSELGEQPIPPGGDFNGYISGNFNYPQRLKEQDEDIKGKIYVSFIVEKDGSLGDVKIVRGLNKLLDEEAIRVIKSSPKWSPGKNAGIPVRARFVQPIRF